ncbi:protein IL-40 [Dasypus novemcinctus]|uniref:protein IL-40 n=1 Tax=Dasypus novemcinctus TaxID=9361 RepID=UPI000328D99D|nr:protein IL-40 [Dasypus novemcinctus]
MRLPLLLCWATLATSGFSKEQAEELLPEVFIAYEVLEVFPKGRLVIITCHAPQASPPVTYSLWGTQGIQVTKKTVKTRQPTSFAINVTLKSRPDLLTYSCQAATTSWAGSVSAPLQMYWELWAKPVSQPQANFTLMDQESDLRMEVSCWVPSGSPPITYSLVGKDGRVHLQQTPRHGQRANFSFPLTQTSHWLQCQARNDISIESSAFELVPPGELPRGPAVLLVSSLTCIAAITSGMLGWALRPRL